MREDADAESMLMTDETDILIIGAGAAGLTAAISASEAGARVTIIEKGDQLGGSTSVSGGIVWVPNNHYMVEANIDDSRDDALAYFESLNHGDIDEVLLTTFIDQGPEALKFLESKGALSLSILSGYPDYYISRPGAKSNGGRALDNDLFSFADLGEWANKIYQSPSLPRLMLRETPLGGASGFIEPDELEDRVKKDARGWGQALLGRLLHACLKRNIEPQLGARAKRLLLDKGTVKGAVISSGEKERTIKARCGVILTTGGFEWDKDLRQTFLRGPMDAPASPPMNQGDGLKMAMSAGAALGNMTNSWWVPTVSIPGDHWESGEQRSQPVLIERTLPHTIMVNARGERFCNEANNYCSLAGSFHTFDPATYSYPNLPAFLIFDQQYRQHYPFASLMPNEETPNWMYQAPSPEELGELIGVDGSALRQTIETFNINAAKGRDPHFNRGESIYDRFYGDRSKEGAKATLAPLTQAPYFAVEIKMGTLGTNGGAKTDGKARVLDHDGNTIPGLFAAGNVMSGPTGGVYAGAGGTLGPALTFGFVAGRQAATQSTI